MCGPATLATTAKVVMIPSRAPNTMLLMNSPDLRRDRKNARPKLKEKRRIYIEIVLLVFFPGRLHSRVFMQLPVAIRVTREKKKLTAKNSALKLLHHPL